MAELRIVAVRDRLQVILGYVEGGAELSWAKEDLHILFVGNHLRASIDEDVSIYVQHTELLATVG